MREDEPMTICIENKRKFWRLEKRKKKLTSSFYIYTYTHTYIYMHMRKSELAYKILWVMGSHLWWFFLSFVLIEEFKNIYRLVWMRSTKNSVWFFFFPFFPVHNWPKKKMLRCMLLIYTHCILQVFFLWKMFWAPSVSSQAELMYRSNASNLPRMQSIVKHSNRNRWQ